MNANPSRRAFTLIELIVMPAMLVMMMALIFPALQRVRGAARTSACMNNMTQLGLATLDFLTKRRVYPSACTVQKEAATGWVSDAGFDPNSRVGWSWIVQILPQLEQMDLYDRLRLKEAGPLAEPASVEGTPHKDVMNTTFDPLICPSFTGNRWRDPVAKTEAITNYKAMAATHLESLRLATPQHEEAKPGYPERREQDFRIHPDGAMFPGSSLDDKDFAQDGASHTIFVCESVEQNAARWTLGMETLVVGLPPEVTYTWHEIYSAPDGFDGNFGPQGGVRKAHPDWVAYVGYDYQNKRYQDYTGGTLQAIYGPSSHHRGYVNHLFGDCNVRMINDDIDLALYMFLITRNGRDPTAGFFR